MNILSIKTWNIVDLLVFQYILPSIDCLVAFKNKSQDGRSDGQMFINGKNKKRILFPNMLKVGLDMHLPALGVQKPIST